MRFDMQAGRGLVAVFGLGLGLMFAAGCGGDSTRPEPEVTVMGGILVARGTPPGTPYQAAAAVSVDGRFVTDADVRINGVSLTYVENPGKPEETGYLGLVSASQGDRLTLTATTAGRTVTWEATVPGMVEIQPPAGGFVNADNQDIPITWVPATGTALTIATCAAASSTTPVMWLLASDGSEQTIPFSATSVPGNRITVMGISGSGDLPSTLDLSQWAGKNGFWVTCQDYVDVMITG